MARKFRRFAYGHDDNGVATAISDTHASCILQRPNRPGVSLTNLWMDEKTPAQMEHIDDPVTGPLILQRPANGSVFPVVQFDPENPDFRCQGSVAGGFNAPTNAQNYCA